MSVAVIGGPGSKAPVSGVYEILDATGTATGERRAVAAGERFPPTPGRGFRFRLVRKVEAAYTSASSAAAIEETMSTWEQVFSRLAER